jgi:hypothetical protein
VKTEADEALWFVLPTEAPFRWPVLLVHHDHDMLHDFDAEAPGSPALHGLCDDKTRTIYLNASLATSTIHEAAQHEIIHAFLWDLTPSRLMNSRIAHDMEELFIRQVSPALYKVARPRWPAFSPECWALIRAARRHRGRAA